jgi:hypothetical protein
MNDLTYNGQLINQRDDGMVNLTQMAKANGVLVADWQRLKSTDKYINELALVVGNPITNILTTDRQDGTYAHPLLAIEFGRWISPAFAIWCDRHIQRLVATGSTTLETDRQHLEVSATPKPKLSEIRQAARMFRDAFGESYYQRYLQQMTAKHYPALVGSRPESSELASLPTATALLNPTHIAAELGWWCKSNPQKGDARKVNRELARLGYQQLIGERWSATEKAIAANLVDRKPVDTNSRTQKDQLLWSANIVAILQEHSEAEVAAI